MAKKGYSYPIEIKYRKKNVQFCQALILYHGFIQKSRCFEHFKYHQEYILTIIMDEQVNFLYFIGFREWGTVPTEDLCKKPKRYKAPIWRFLDLRYSLRIRCLLLGMTTSGTRLWEASNNCMADGSKCFLILILKSSQFLCILNLFYSDIL